MPADNPKDTNPRPEINRLIHEPARYNIMALLYVVEQADFLFMQNQTGLTPGNLSTHLSKLETAGYVDIQKGFVGKRPKTSLRLTTSGRQEFETYRQQMQKLLASPPGFKPESEDN